jgi:hypothetical protein
MESTAEGIFDKISAMRRLLGDHSDHVVNIQPDPDQQNNNPNAASSSNANRNRPPSSSAGGSRADLPILSDVYVAMPDDGSGTDVEVGQVRDSIGTENGLEQLRNDRDGA